MTSIMDKATTRNILSVSTVGVFLWAIVYSTMNIEKVSRVVESSSLISAFIGGFMAIIPIVYYFYFRKAQEKESSLPTS